MYYLSDHVLFGYSCHSYLLLNILVYNVRAYLIIGRFCRLYENLNWYLHFVICEFHTNYTSIYYGAKLRHNFTFHPLLAVTLDFRLYFIVSQKNRYML
jgi:hypothetical protein